MPGLSTFTLVRHSLHGKSRDRLPHIQAISFCQDFDRDALLAINLWYQKYKENNGLLSFIPEAYRIPVRMLWYQHRGYAVPQAMRARVREQTLRQETERRSRVQLEQSTQRMKQRMIREERIGIRRIREVVEAVAASRRRTTTTTTTVTQPITSRKRARGNDGRQIGGHLP